MKITKKYISKFWTITPIVFTIVAAIIVPFAVVDTFGMINYYCVALNPFWWLYLQGFAFCPVYVTIGYIFSVGLGVIFLLLLGCLLGDLFVYLFKRIRHVYLKVKHSYQRETMGDFSPTIYQDKDIFYLKIICPKQVLFSATIAYSLEYLKPDSLEIEKTKPKTKNELISNLMKNMINPPTIKISNWFNFPSVKVRRNKTALIPVFEIDPKEEIFYLYRKSGKPERFWNNEELPQLEEMSFGHGKYNFKLIISANFQEKKIVQLFPFSMEF